MRHEYMLTDEQKKAIAEIDEQIFHLQLKRTAILLSANCRYITETEEEFEAADRYLQDMQRFATYGQPIIRNDAIVKINFGGNEDE